MCSSGVKECGACGSPDPEFACSRCKAARFCGPECFRKAWPAHKAICGARAEKEKERPHPWPSPFSCVRAQSEGLVQTGRTGRIAFIDFWPGFEDNTDLWFCQDWFKRNLPGVEIVDASASPDVIMFSMFGKRYISLLQSGSSAKLVFFTGENLRPPVGRVPLCVSFDHLEGVPQSIHARIPLWVFNMEVHEVLTMHAARLSGKVDESVWKRDFCCWVASNATMYRAEFRTRFVKTLSARYKQVDCGGAIALKRYCMPSQLDVSLYTGAIQMLAQQVIELQCL
ncbi:NADH oxidase, partial [Durusdinium trenchii]